MTSERFSYKTIIILFKIVSINTSIFYKEKLVLILRHSKKEVITIEKLKKYIKNPFKVFEKFSTMGLLDFLSDEKYLEYMFRARMGQKLNLSNPQTFNEKLQWLKLYDRKDIYSTMVDKYEVKKYVSSIIGDEYIIPTLGVWSDFDGITFSDLPEKFVLKCTHDSGGLVICRDINSFDKENAKKKIEKSLKNNYYLRGGREWPYKNVKPRVIAEKFMQDGIEIELKDYKFYCFNGEPKFLYLSQGLENHSTAHISFVNLDRTFAPFGRSDYLSFKKLPCKPKNFELMIVIAKKLSKGIPFLRVDLYEINERVYFGELTFSPVSGFMPFEPPEADEKVGDLLILPNN